MIAVYKCRGSRVKSGECKELFPLKNSIGRRTNRYKWVMDKLRLEILRRFPAIRGIKH